MSSDLHQRRLELRKQTLRRMVNTPQATDRLWAEAARDFLQFYHRGPGRMLIALTGHALKRAWLHHGWPKWEWFRVHVLRRPQDPVLAEYERTAAEMDAVEEMAAEL